MPERHIYEHDLSAVASDSPSAPDDLTVRTPGPDDHTLLAALMLDAYSGTIDDDGGIMEDAMTEVRNYFAGEYGAPLLHASRLAVAPDGRGAAAVLITRWGRTPLPLVAFVMTDPTRQKKGAAGFLLHQALVALKGAGESAVRAVITDGNVPSERLFVSAGFRRLGKI